MGKKLSLKIKFGMIIASLVVLIISIVFPVLAVILFSSDALFGGTVGVDTVFTENNNVIFTQEEIDAGSSGSSYNSSTNTYTFTSAGQYFQSNQKLKNNSNEHLSYYYNLEQGTSKNENLAKSVLVYYNGEYVGTLSELISLNANGKPIEIGNSYVLKGGSRENLFKFELHTDASESFNSQNNERKLSVKIKCVAQTPNYVSTMFVTNEAELVAAVNDVNFGSKGTIVLCNDIVLTKDIEFKKAATIDFFGNTISNATLIFSGIGESTIKSSKAISDKAACKVALNNTDGFINVSDEFGGKIEVTASNYLASEAKRVLFDYFSKRIGGALLGGESVKLGSGMKYVLADGVTLGSGISYNSETDILTAEERENSINSRIIIGVDGFAATYSFKIIGSGDSSEPAINAALAHIPDVLIVNENGEDIATYTRVTYGLFLPTRISSINASIEWISSNLEAMDNNGIVQENIENHAVTMTAIIKVNNTVTIRQFSFEVYNQNNASRFASLLAQMDPVSLAWVNPLGGSEVILPGIDGDYTYINGYDAIPNDGSEFSGESPDHKNNKAFSALGDYRIETLSYKVGADYSFLSLLQSNNRSEAYVLLSRATFSTYAQIEVSAKFTNDDTVYEGVVGVSISLGANNELMQEGVDFIQSRLSSIDILQNILDTRLAFGMVNEKGDFSLPTSYNDYFEFMYYIPEGYKNGIISNKSVDTVKYNGIEYDIFNDTFVNDCTINIDASKFATTESSVTLGVLVRLKGEEQSITPKVLTFAVPAAIHMDSQGFENPSVFYSVKYQVYQQLSNTGAANASGFTLNGDKLTVKTGNYILLHDIQQSSVNKLYFQNGTSSTYINSANRNVSNLVEVLTWATATKSYFYNGTPNNGKDYITTKEKEIIFNQLKKINSRFTDSEWNVLWDSLTEQGAGYIFDDGEKMNETIYNIISNYSLSETQSAAYFKWNELIQWATDGQATFDNTKGDYPNSGIIGSPTKSDGSYYYRDALATISEDEYFILHTYWYKLSNENESARDEFTKAWGECCVVPTYLNQTAVLTLIRKLSIYDNSGYQENIVKGDTLNYLYVSSLDGAATGLSYFTHLKDLQVFGYVDDLSQIKGNAYTLTTLENSFSTFPIFSSSTTVTNFFNRIAINNSQIAKLVMQGCAFKDISKLSIDNISGFNELTYLDISANSGISTILPVLNMSTTLEYFDAFWVDVAYNEEFSNRVFATLNLPTNHIYYLNTQTLSRAEFNGVSGEEEYKKLGYLNEVDLLSTDYLQLSTKISSSSSSSNQVFWTQEEGNPILQLNAVDSMKSSVDNNAAYYTLSTAQEMEAAVNEIYLYVNSSNSITYNNLTFSGRKIYKYNFNTGTLTDQNLTYSSVSITSSFSLPSSNTTVNYFYNGDPSTPTAYSSNILVYPNSFFTVKRSGNSWIGYTYTPDYKYNGNLAFINSSDDLETLKNSRTYFYTGAKTVSNNSSTGCYEQYTMYKLENNLYTPIHSFKSNIPPLSATESNSETFTSIYNAALLTTHSGNVFNPTVGLSKYYGNYYWYSNSSNYTLSGLGAMTNSVRGDVELIPNNIYRLFFDFDNLVWYFEDSGLTCVRITSNNDLLITLFNLLDNDLTNDYPLNQVFYYTGATQMSYKANTFYQLLKNSETGVYYHKRWGDGTLNVDDEQLRLYNDRIYRSSATNEYAGTGGAYDVVLRAWVYTDRKFHSANFSITING